MSIERLEGVGPANAKKLAKAGIRGVAGLLKKGSTPQGRKAIAAASGINERQVLELVNMADLFRVKGVATQYAELLKSSGVDTVKELAMRNADNLHAKMADVNNQKNLVRSIPGASAVQNWVKQAKTLPRAIEY